MRRLVPILALGGTLLLSAVSAWQRTVRAEGNSTEQTPSSPGTSPLDISYQQARPILEALGHNLLPADLKDQDAARMPDYWSNWVTRHDQQLRARLVRGDEDTLVNFLVLGTSFTRQRRLSAVEFQRLAVGMVPTAISPDDSPESVVFFKRVGDLLHGLANPGNNERLLYLAQFVEKQGYHPRQAYAARPDLAEQARLKSYVLSNTARVFREQERLQILYDQTRETKDHSEDLAEVSTLYRSRGVSLDTSLLPNVAVENSLKEMQTRGLLAPDSVHRAAVIGPGLDFTDKLGGYDFYPQQTIQCFAFVDTLFRLGLAQNGKLEVITFDISQRVNEHLQHARRRARQGQGYVLQLPRDGNASWNPATTLYWLRFGDRIGTPVAAIRPPSLAGRVETRAVQVRPAVVSMVTPVDLDVVTQRLDLSPQQRFDLIIATNVFCYFDSFEQLLAVANAQSMLRPGGFLLSNSVLPLLPSIQMRFLDNLSITYSDQPNDGDVVSWYQRTPD